MSLHLSSRKIQVQQLASTLGSLSDLVKQLRMVMMIVLMLIEREQSSLDSSILRVVMNS